MLSMYLNYLDIGFRVTVHFLRNLEILSASGGAGLDTSEGDTKRADDLPHFNRRDTEAKENLLPS